MDNTTKLNSDTIHSMLLKSAKVAESAIKEFDLDAQCQMEKESLSKLLEGFIYHALILSNPIEQLKADISIFFDAIEGETGVYLDIESDTDTSSETILFEYVLQKLQK